MMQFKLANRYLTRDVYNSCIDQEHFLVQLGRLFDWNDMALPLVDLAKNAEGGRPRHSPVVMLKMLLLSFLFDLSDRETEFFCTSNLYAKYFLELPINEKSPDHTCLPRFRDAVIGSKGVSFFTDTFRALIAEAKEHGVVFGVIHALDATHTIADVDTAIDGQNQKRYGSKPRDPDADWGVKGQETKMTPSGQQVSVLKTFFGYKSHLLAETNYGIITGLATTPGNIADIDGGDLLIHRILTEEERKNIGVLLADKGYGCPVWINLLEKYANIMTAFSLPTTMTERGEHRKKWTRYYHEDENRKTLRKERYVIERTNADLKDNHSLRRCRYIGNTKYALQSTMASMVHNLKIFVRVLTGARLRPI